MSIPVPSSPCAPAPRRRARWASSALPVAVVSAELGVSWWTVLDAVIAHGTPLVDDPERVGWVRALGIDKTSFLSATWDHHTIYATTGMVDLDDPKVIDMVEGNSAADLRRWFEAQDRVWLEAIEVVATDLAESYRLGMAGPTRPRGARGRPVPCRSGGQPVVDKVRRHVQNETLGHGGRKGDPL